jgi:xanthine dehydrogenase accessory factor
MPDTAVTHSLKVEPPVYGDYVLEALLDWRREGMRTALLTLVRIDGASPRPLGSQIAVAEDGRAMGAITGGCAEQALVLDALAAIARGQNHVEVYGEGSRFKDIVLPCGSGIHVAFDVTLDVRTLSGFVAARKARRQSVYNFVAPGYAYEHTYLPQLRTVILGRGNIVPVLAQFASLSEMQAMVWSADETTFERSAPFAQVSGLRAPSDWDQKLLDPYTALISLFHEHDYEPDILEAALASPAFYIGALGSQRTHARRLETLAARGWSAKDLARICGPVGLDIGAKTPPEIAVSIIAEIIDAHRRRDR